MAIKPKTAVDKTVSFSNKQYIVFLRYYCSCLVNIVFWCLERPSLNTVRDKAVVIKSHGDKPSFQSCITNDIISCHFVLGRVFQKLLPSLALLLILSRAVPVLGDFFQQLLPSLALLLILSRAVLFLGDFFKKLPPNLALLLILSRAVLFLGESKPQLKSKCSLAGEFLQICDIKTCGARRVQSTTVHLMESLHISAFLSNQTT